MKLRIYKFTSIMIFFLLGLLPGCTKVIHWASDCFPQSKKRVVDYTLINKYVRSVKMYDQFTTKAQFDALWISDPIRKLYVDEYVQIAGKSVDQKNILLRRQSDESKHFIMFFVLTPYEVTLGERDSGWGVLLKLDDMYFDAIEVKSVQLLPIYQNFFGNKYTNFKSVYQIKFDTQDVQDNLLLTSDTKKVALCFRSVTEEVLLEWNIADLGEILAEKFEQNDESIAKNSDLKREKEFHDIPSKNETSRLRKTKAIV